MPEYPATKITPPDSSVFESRGPAQLRHQDSSKWRMYPEDVIPLWVAEMDFPVAPPLLDAMRRRLEHPLGYNRIFPDAPLNALLQEKFREQGLGDVPTEGMVYLPGVVPGIYAALQATTAPGDRVVMVTPIYHNFHIAASSLGREPVGVPLLNRPERWEMDWDALDVACEGAKLLMVCHPHNPTGRVWDAEELNRLRDLALKHDLYVISDELHADLRYIGQPFEAFAADERVREHTVTLTGPGKAFNTAGVGMGVMFSHNPKLAQKLQAAASGVTGHPSALGVSLWQAALEEGDPWLAGTLAYLEGNRDFLTDFLRQHLPWVKFHPVEATYLAWLDLSAHPQAASIQNDLLTEARVAVNGGLMFAPEPQKALYQGFIRLNFASPRPILEEALERMARALGNV